MSNDTGRKSKLVVRNIDYGLSDTRWKVVGLGRSEHTERVLRMTLAKADTSTFMRRWQQCFRHNSISLRNCTKGGERASRMPHLNKRNATFSGEFASAENHFARPRIQQDTSPEDYFRRSVHR